MHKFFALFLALGAVAVQVRAAEDHAIDTLKAAKLGSFMELIEGAGATAAFSNEKARVTLLAPTDEAFAAFLKEMGLTKEELMADADLADKIVAYHTVIGVTAGPKELFAKGDSVLVPTASAPYKLKVSKTGDGVSVMDFQGNVATISTADLGSGNHRVHAIDKVLYSGAYWTDLAKLIKAMPGRFSTIGKAAEVAGMAESLTAQSFADTVFLPTNDAFEKAGVSLDAPSATIANILKYHVVAGERNIPAGFVEGAAVPTLQGEDITVTYVDAEAVAGIPAKTAMVTDAAGKKVMVVKPNVHIGKSVSHVIDGVLMPKADAAAAITAAATGDTTATSTSVTVAAPAAATTTVAPAASTSSGKGGIWQIFQSLWPFGRSSGGSMFSIRVSGGKGGRKLMQLGDGGAGEYTSTLSLDSSEQAILNAVNSNASLGATEGAAAENLGNAELSTIYPTHPTYADGIDQYAAYGTGGN